MPTGQKTITWTAANDERLLLSILAVHNIKVDGPKVAKVFGNNIAASVIQTRMTKLKAKARALNPGVVPTDAVVPSITKRKSETTDTKSGKVNKKVKTEPAEDEEEHVTNLMVTQANAVTDHAVTPPATPRKKTSTTPNKSSKLTTPSPKAAKENTDGHSQGKRCSPRDSLKVNYHQLDDPFVYMEGGVGGDETNVFGQATDSESEDSVNSDKDFEGDGEEVSTEA